MDWLVVGNVVALVVGMFVALVLVGSWVFASIVVGDIMVVGLEVVVLMGVIIVVGICLGFVVEMECLCLGVLVLRFFVCVYVFFFFCNYDVFFFFLFPLMLRNSGCWR